MDIRNLDTRQESRGYLVWDYARSTLDKNARLTVDKAVGTTDTLDSLYLIWDSGQRTLTRDEGQNAGHDVWSWSGYERELLMPVHICWAALLVGINRDVEYL